MSTRDLIDMALRNLWKRKLRTVLTVLGVVIGTVSIVIMISIGIGMNESFRQQIEQWGNLQVIQVNNYGAENDPTKKIKLNKETLNTFSKMEYVEAVTPVVTEWMYLTCNKKYLADVSLVGIWPETMEAMGYTVVEGRTLTAEDKDAIVVGGAVAQQFYNPKLNWEMRWNSEPPTVDLFNDRITITYDYNYGTRNADKKIKDYKVNVIGKMSDSGSNSYSVVMPLEKLEEIQKEKKEYEEKMYGSSSSGSQSKSKEKTYQQVSVKVEDMEHVEEVQQAIKDMGFSAYSLTDELKAMQETTKMLRMVLGAIGAISLIVAAIGITNTMVMAIYERTKEIGIMKVIGASLSDIKRLFLAEAAFIGFAGGVIGAVISFGMSHIVNIVAAQQASQMQSSIPIWLYASAILFATFIGVLSGYLPAKRAMRLSALTAIRTE